MEINQIPSHSHASYIPLGRQYYPNLPYAGEYDNIQLQNWGNSALYYGGVQTGLNGGNQPHDHQIQSHTKLSI